MSSIAAPFAPASHRRFLAPDRGRLWDEARVSAVTPESTSATILRLALPTVPELRAGQYLLLRLATASPPGVVEQAYSVSSSPYPPGAEIEIAVREVAGGRVSPLLAHHVQVGDLLHVRGPFGFLTWSEEDGGPLLLLGAGSGVAPPMSIVRYSAARGATTPMTVLCSSRDRSTVLFRQPLEKLDRSQPWLSVVHTFTRDSDDPYPRYHRRIDAAMIDEVTATSFGSARADVTYLVAGPPDMVAVVRRALAELGVPDARMASEDHA
jgi:ferredoxin-NADP reductase